MTSEQNDRYFGKDLEAMSFAYNYHCWILAEFLPYLRGSVAEVGAGVGNVSSLLLETNIHKLSAYEPSQNMFPLLEKALKGEQRANVINGFFGKDETPASFDCVVYINVLEHIEDHVSELANARAALVDDGYLLIFVPALQWLYSDFDRQVGHYRRYTKKNLMTLVREAGYNIVKAKYLDMVGIVPWYINFTLLKNSMSGGSVSLYDRMIVPVARSIEGIVPPPVGKNVLLVARKDA